MDTRTIIPAHNGFPFRRIKKVTFYNHSNLIQTDLHPSLYSMVRNTSGEVTLTEYATPAEYHAHRNECFAAIARYHAHFGKREGCECTTCRS